MAEFERVLLANPVPLDGSGSGTYTLAVAQALQDEGKQVKVLVAGPLGTAGNIDVRSIGYEDGSFPTFTHHPAQNEPLQFVTMGAKTQNVYIKKWHDALAATVKEFNPDAAHLGHAYAVPGIAADIFNRRHHKISMLSTLHGTEMLAIRQDPDGKFTQLARKGHEKTDGIIAVSNNMKRLAQDELQIPEHKIPISPNGFDPGIFEPNPAIDKEEVLRRFNLEELSEKPIVYTSGRLIDVKRHDRTIEAIALASRFIPDIHLVHCGGGDENLKQQLMEYASKLNVLDRIHFLGNQPQPTLNDIANVSELGLFSSDFEAFGLVALEALATGTPVIATNIGGFPDFVNEHVGRLVEPNANSIADAIIEEINGDAKKIKGPIAASHARSFTWKNHIVPMLEIWSRNSK